MNIQIDTDLDLEMDAWRHGLVNRCMDCLVDGCLGVSLAVRMHGRLNGTN